MIEFGYILIIIIIFELIAAFLIIYGLISLEKKVKNSLYNISKQAKNTLCAIKNVRSNLKGFNKSFSNITSLDIHKIKQVVFLILDIANFILLIKSMDFRNLSKNKNLKWKNIKKLIPFSLIKKFINNFKSV